MSITLTTITQYLDNVLMSERFPDDQNGIYRPSSRPISRIGLSVEPWRGIDEWVRRQRLDALFLHRPWRLDLESLPRDVGVLAYHLAFDLTLTFAYNPRLAAALSMSTPTPFAYKEGIPHIPYGMFGDIAPSSLSNITALLADVFGNTPSIETRYIDTVQRIAIVGAMSDTFVREAAMHNVDLYITGQFRQPARTGIQETQMNVAIIGHAAGEQWGIHALAGILQEQWAQLEISVGA